MKIYDALEEEELRPRRLKLMIQCQEYIDKNVQVTPAIGQISGRFVKQIDSGDSKESRCYHNYALSCHKECLAENYVNTTKKIKTTSRQQTFDLPEQSHPISRSTKQQAITHFISDILTPQI